MKLPWSSRAPKPEDELKTSQERYVENVLEAERADDRIVTRNQNGLLRRKWAIYIGITSGILALFASCSNESAISDLKNNGVGSAQTASTGNGADSPGRFAATQSVQQWLASTPSPLPGGQLQAWTGAQQLPKQSTTDSSTGETVKREMDSFSLVDGYGRGYTASVEVAYTDSGKTSVIAGPSLTPIATSSNSNFAGSQTWPGLDSTTPSQTVSTAIQQWASAYAGGNADALRQAIGDPSTTHVYVPLTGVSSVTTTVPAVAVVGDNEIAQVSVVPQWSGRSYNGQPPTPMQFDVLVSGPNTASPRVVAWGAPGSGPTLKAYQNATTLTAQEANNAGSNATSSDSASPTTKSAPPTGEGTAPKPASTQNASPSASSTSAPQQSHKSEGSASSHPSASSSSKK